ncbi:hypothetical protein J6590_057397 [Homalodisca vitripennis]|nr:hypothetical protein J6590_057397 [Homalodisca vitripennis]
MTSDGVRYVDNIRRHRHDVECLRLPDTGLYGIVIHANANWFLCWSSECEQSLSAIVVRHINKEGRDSAIAITRRDVFSRVGVRHTKYCLMCGKTCDSLLHLAQQLATTAPAPAPPLPASRLQ